MDAITGGEEQGGVQDKMSEYRILVAPVEQAIKELQLARGMLRAKAESEIHSIAPALAALSEALNISTLDLLLAPDRSLFLQEAFAATGASPDSVREKILAASSGEYAETMSLLSAEEQENYGTKTE